MKRLKRIRWYKLLRKKLKKAALILQIQLDRQPLLKLRVKTTLLKIQKSIRIHKAEMS